MRNRILAVAGLAAAAVMGAGVSLAATAPGASSTTIHGCENSKTRALYVRHGRSCGKGYTPLAWNQTGPQGPSGVVSTATTDLGGFASVPTGGGFVANSTAVGTVPLKAGTYLISVNAKATPNAVTSGAVFPQFFVYNQAKNSSFTGDLFNVGSGSLEQFPTTVLSTKIDSYYSGSAVITLASDTTLHVYAFGYDSDQGAGSYALDDLSVTATRIKTS